MLPSTSMATAAIGHEPDDKSTAFGEAKKRRYSWIGGRMVGSLSGKCSVDE